MNQYEEKTLTGETIYEGKIITLRVEEVELPDGNKATTGIDPASGRGFHHPDYEGWKTRPRRAI